MSKSNPHRRIVLKMSYSSASKLLMYLSLAKKYAHIFEYDMPSYENGIVEFRKYIISAIDNCDGVHQSVVDVRLNDIT